MRIGFVSDIHSNKVALDSVLEDIDNKEYDKLVCLGDVVGYGPQPKECLDCVKNNCDVIIQGNHDRLVGTEYMDTRLPLRVKKGLQHSESRLTKSDIEWLRTLPEKKSYNNETYIVHSHPKVQDKYVKPREFYNMVEVLEELSAIYIALGHTHIQAHRKFNDKYHVFNPGSVGQPRDGSPESGYAILDTEKESVETYRVSYDIRKVISQVKSISNLPSQNGERLAKGR